MAKDLIEVLEENNLLNLQELQFSFGKYSLEKITFSGIFLWEILLIPMINYIIRGQQLTDQAMKDIDKSSSESSKALFFRLHFSLVSKNFSFLWQLNFF